MDMMNFIKKMTVRVAVLTFTAAALAFSARFVFPGGQGLVTHIDIAASAGTAISADYPGKANVSAPPAQELYGMSFQYPYGFNIADKSFEGGEILYHSDFTDEKNPAIHGFIEVWNMPGSLEKFLRDSKESSTLSFDEFVSEPVKAAGIYGYKWEYLLRTDQNKRLKGIEVFLQKNGRMYRISYFVPEKDWTRRQKNIFDRLLASVSII